MTGRIYMTRGPRPLKSNSNMYTRVYIYIYIQSLSFQIPTHNNPITIIVVFPMQFLYLLRGKKERVRNRYLDFSFFHLLAENERKREFRNLFNFHVSKYKITASDIHVKNTLKKYAEYVFEYKQKYFLLEYITLLNYLYKMNMF